MMEKNNEGYGVLLRSSRFSPFFTSQILTNLGDGLFSVSLIYYALQIGASPALLGSIVFSITLARGLLGPFGGVMSDRMDRRHYLIAIEALRALCVLLIPLLTWTGWMNVWWLSGIGVIISTLFAISVPAAKALIPEMVDKSQLQQANGLIQTITWPAFFLGSGLLALVQGKLPAFALFIIIGSAFVISTLLLCGLPKTATRSSEGRRLTMAIFLQELRNGYLALNVDPVMRARVWLYGAFTFFWRGSLQICIPILILRHLESPQWLYGSLMFVNGLAELLANLYVGKRFMARPLIFTYSCEILMGAGLLIMAASLWLPFTYIWIFIAVILIGVAAATIDIPLMTVIQKQVPAEHVGKVVSYWFTIGSFGGAMGSLLLGMLFGITSVSTGIIFTGVSCLLIGIFFYLWASKRNSYIEVRDN
ncbi:MFS transporter [Salmonella enterica subsp. enterica]|nr:MFS transporter [Salmonella enterica]EBQ9479950.1 MFS transporter [Salmonella enterica subsp. enterica serovar Kokomlemle]ECS5198523.1 MFS transporter [Salmonella enterica subsp. enterica serovar Poano]EBJ7122015.1 MFS transporter [Salmonella enterica]ECX4750938.1 MFS transporter [Salmonella enterica]